MQAEILGKDCFINSQGPRLCGLAVAVCVAHLGRLLLLLFFFSCSQLCLALSGPPLRPGFALITGGARQDVLDRCVNFTYIKMDGLIYQQEDIYK